jgi:hypothetical protein
MIVTRCADWAQIHKGKRPVISITLENDWSEVTISDGICDQCYNILKEEITAALLDYANRTEPHTQNNARTRPESAGEERNDIGGMLHAGGSQGRDPDAQPVSGFPVPDAA